MSLLPHTCPSDIAHYFDQIPDPRSHINRVHPLSRVLAIAIMAILGGATGPTAIARWARAKKDFLGHCFPSAEGLPCKDVFRIVLSRLHPKLFQACFSQWVESLRLDAMKQRNIERPIYAIDGKTLRRSHDHANDLGALHSVSVWASELGLSLAQVACAEKSNEITAIPEVLQLVDITGAIITIDAMGTQKAIAKQISDGKGDYVFALKANQEKLHDFVVDYIGQQLETDFANVAVQQKYITEKLHGEEDLRIYTQMPVPPDMPMLKDWAGLRTIGTAVRCYRRNGLDYSDVRYYISSLAMDVVSFGNAVRQHWGVENGCHWILDMTFREDESRIRGKYIRENMAWLNRMALSLLKQHPRKDSIAGKRQTCGWNDDFLVEVLTGITT